MDIIILNEILLELYFSIAAKDRKYCAGVQSDLSMGHLSHVPPNCKGNACPCLSTPFGSPSTSN